MDVTQNYIKIFFKNKKLSLLVWKYVKNEFYALKELISIFNALYYLFSHFDKRELSKNIIN